MFGNLDTGCFNIEPDDILGSVGEKTEEDAFTGVRLELDTSATRRANPDAASKGAESAEIVLVAGGEFHRRSCLILGGNGVGNAQVVVKSVRPESCVEIGAVQHCADAVGDSQMSAFNRTVLIGRVGPSWTDFVVELLEEFSNFRVVVELATLIEINVFPGNAR